MVKTSRFLSLISCLLLSSSSTSFQRLSDSRRLLLRDENTGKFILYEFEDLDWDGNVEVCISGDPERTRKVYAYFSKKHARDIESLIGLPLGKTMGYSSAKINYPSTKAEVIIMDNEDQNRANYFFSLAERSNR